MDIYRVLSEEIPGFSTETKELPFSDLGIDSFGLISLRVRLEYVIGRVIIDTDWTSLNTPAQLQSLIVNMMREDGEAVTLPTTIDTTKRTYSLNMPQMAMGGLSESWCLKEFGDLHWGMILSGLGTSSSKLADGLGERLYATFTRIKYDSTHPLSAFTEDENVVIEGNLTRLGAGIFISNITLSGSNKSIKVNAMSSFTKRGVISSNVNLLKGQPNIPDDCPIQVINEMPRFGLEYRNLREGLFSEPLFESSYDIIPYYDINGVSLLYFAAYPIISDICELRYMNVGNRWATRASTVKRDIYYFANSDMNKPLIYRVHVCRKLDSGIEIESSISRADDNKMMAYIITRKDVADE